MKRAVSEALLAALLILLFIGVLWIILGAGMPRRSCCSDRDILVKGMCAAYQEIKDGDPEAAAWILEETSRAVGEEMEPVSFTITSPYLACVTDSVPGAVPYCWDTSATVSVSQE